MNSGVKRHKKKQLSLRMCTDSEQIISQKGLIQMAHLAGAVVDSKAGVATAIMPSKTKQMATLHIHILRFCAVYFMCFCSPTFPASRLRENITTAGLSRSPL